MAMNPNEFDDFLEDDDAPDQVVDTRADGRLLRVPLGRIAPNLVNPRSDFGTTEQLEDFGRSLKRRQIQAVPVVTRRAYLELWPEHKGQIGNVDFVIVSGERRYRAATAVELPALECVINDGYAESRKTFLDAVVSENIDRQNFDAIEEANAVEVLVEAFGTARSVAEHYERADGWVSQRRVLLRLAPEVQELVRHQQMPLEPARKLGKLVKDHQWDVDAQFQWWEQEQKDRAAKAAQRKATRAARRSQPAGGQAAPSEPVFTAVKPAPEPATPRETPARAPALPEATAALTGTHPAGVPEPRDQGQASATTPWGHSRGLTSTTLSGADQVEPQGTGKPPAAEPPIPVRQLPTHDWEQLANIVIAELPEAALHCLTERLLEAVGVEPSSQSA
ncbi:ParB/RepB/Spo0J family partition protein [Streptomyces californicus]|uniref:ParB/RepB/Spo0J family partition protein n=2 Tax=Streptomyces TaxID=1883 RepID=UPI0012FF2A72|nr:ParB N-terminal domain-containing protein [Streptomyces californicus]QRV59409.1 ParB N-terminal domain-containing protein [Streptomyces californicus]